MDRPDVWIIVCMRTSTARLGRSQLPRSPRELTVAAPELGRAITGGAI